MSRTLYLDCFSGIAGDMLVGALIDAGASFERIEEGLHGLGVGGFTVQRRDVQRCGLRGVKFDVVLDAPDTTHRGLKEIHEILDGGNLSDGAAIRAAEVFRVLARAEAHVHGVDVDEVHFHEVGAIDAICDVVGAAIALDELDTSYVGVGPLRAGSGFVECAHGKMPVPAPGALECLKGFDVRLEEGRDELVTPTGAAFLGALATPAAPGPLVVEAVGYGAGTRDPSDVPNLLRAVVGHAPDQGDAEVVWELRTNLDHLAPTVLQNAIERAMDSGALDAHVTACTMKKGRPGHLLTALVPASCRTDVERAIFRETGTLGIRRTAVQRTVLERDDAEVKTPWGYVRLKIGRYRETVTSAVPEYEDCRRLAEEHGVPVQHVIDAAKAAFGRESGA